MKLSAELQKRIIGFLTSLPGIIDDTKSQKAFIYSASLDQQLQNQIQFGDPPALFVPLLIAKLIDYGKLKDGRHALEAILETANNYIGRDRQAYNESLLQELQAYLKSIAIKDKPQNTPYQKVTQPTDYSILAAKPPISESDKQINAEDINKILFTDHYSYSSAKESPFIDPTTKFPDSIEFPEFPLTDKLKEYLKTLQKERILILSCIDEKTLHAAAYAIMREPELNAYEKRMLVFDGNNASRTDLTFDIFVNESIGNGKDLIVIISLKVNAFFDSMPEELFYTVYIKERLKEKNILLICLANSEIQEALKERKRFPFSSWEIPFSGCSQDEIDSFQEEVQKNKQSSKNREKVDFLKNTEQAKPNISRALQVFLCHSSKDKRMVRKLYQLLCNEDIDPWLDEEKLLPGQNWNREITNAVRNSDAVIICLSGNAINKRGYIQKEIRIALDVADEQPEGSIFIIPLKLEVCDVPEQLHHLHWVNYFEEKGYNKLMRALQFRATELGLELKTKMSSMRNQHLEPDEEGKKGNANNINKLKILFIGTNPITTVRLKLDEEVKRIQMNLKLAKERDNLEFGQEWAVTIDTLMQAILDETPNIVHFSGHGQQNGIILQNEIGEPNIIPTEALASLFKLFKDVVKCVVLNSCYSETQAKAIKLHIPYVIGIQSSITDKAAIAFSTGFYKAIGFGKDIPFAFEFGVTAIKLEGVSGDDIPILLK